MAVTASGLFVATLVDVLDATQLGLDLTATTHRLALFNRSSITPNYTTDTAYGTAPFSAGEVYGTGWAQGGIALSAAAVGGTSTAPTLTGSSGAVVYDMGDVSVAGTTLSSAGCVLLYADGLAGKNAIALIDFGADYSTSAGVFGITWGSSVFSIDVTP